MPIQRTAQITIPLDIADVDVKEMIQEKDGSMTVTVVSRSNETECGICKRMIRCQHGCGEVVRLRHLPILGRKTYIQIRPKRAKCDTCPTSPTTTQTAAWYQQRSPHTKAYDRHLMRQLRGSTVVDVSAVEGIGYGAVLGALERLVPSKIEWDKIDKLETIGIDEVATRKGHKGYKAVITARGDDGTVQVLAVLPDRKKRQ